MFQVLSCCSIWLSSWISAGTAEQLSASAQACTAQHDLHSNSGQSTKCCTEFCSSRRAPPPNPPLGLPACAIQPFTPACYSLRAWSGRIPRAFCILSLLLLFHIVATDGWPWLTTTTKSSSSRKHSAFMRSLQLGDILIQSTPSGPLDL